MKNYQAIALSTSTVAVNILLDHYCPAFGVVGIPIAAAMTTCFIVFAARHVHIMVAAILSYVYVGANDIGLRLYGNALTHPWGRDYIFLYYLFGVGMAFILLIVALRSMKTVKLATRITALLLFILLSCLHLRLLSALGMEFVFRMD